MSRPFKLTKSFIENYQNQQPDWNDFAYLTYKRTYARTKEDGSLEEFFETIQRVVEGCYSIQKKHCENLGVNWDHRKAQNSAQQMYERMWSFKFLPPGRGLWAMGTTQVQKKGAGALLNCAFISTKDIKTDFADPFCFMMDMSMLGVGVGSDTRGENTVTIKEPKVQGDFIVEDSREGWVELIKVVFNSYAGKGSYPQNIDYSQIRKKGQPLKTFGGICSGAKPLKVLIDDLNSVFRERQFPYKISSQQIVDLFNVIGKCVVAGNIRRTAQIMLGNHTDNEFLDLKQDQQKLMSHRWASNNSILGELGMNYSVIKNKLSTNGEPGIVWMHNIQNYSRMKDPPNTKDYRAIGTNPCGEISLESAECCNLVETFPAHHEDLTDFIKTLKFAYLYAKTVTLVPTHIHKTNSVMLRNRRIGCSISGIVQAMHKFGRANFLTWCDKGYERIQQLDQKYSEWLCIPRSKKTTTVKPSGTTSILAGATAGIHYPHSEFYIRNIRVPKASPLVKACQKAGYKVEPCVYSDDSMVVSFPIKEKLYTRSKNQASIWQQFANAADLQHYWSDNQVSITITFNEKEKKDITHCLDHFQYKLKSVSLLPIKEHGYEQAPYIEISKENYENLIKGITKIDFENAKHEITEKFCDGDKCEIVI